MTEPHPIMTLEEVADFLRLSPETVRRACHRGEMPGLLPRIGHQWRINRTVFMATMGIGDQTTGPTSHDA